MSRILYIIIALFIYSISTEYSFAEWCEDIKAELPDSETLKSAAKQCVQAREKGNPNSITEFVCPQGNYFDANNQQITGETLSYLIAANISFNKIDTDIKKYMVNLQKKREADPGKWTETIRGCTDKIANIYKNICNFGTLETLLNADPKEPIITTTNTYPQALCTDLARKKVQGWYYLQTIFMSDGISKNQKNSTDKWATTVKWAYGRVLWNFHGYQKILSRAVSKMTAYTKESN